MTLISQILLFPLIAIQTIYLIAIIIPWTKNKNKKEKIAQLKLYVSYYTVNISLLILLALFILLGYYYLTQNTHLINVFVNSHELKPLFYKITAVWGNHEGSMLLFVLFLAGNIKILLSWTEKLELKTRISISYYAILLLLCFVLYITFMSNPFETNDELIGQKGRGFNPLLQNPFLAIHPPIVYLGYTSVSLLYVMGIVSLIQRNFSVNLYLIIQKIAIIALIFLTAGMTLGSYWAYTELGWGGFWFWDPVENTILLPWLTVNALIHILSLDLYKGNFRIWSLCLIFFSFSLVIMGFFLVRSGILTSVHAFSLDPTKGSFFLIIWMIISILPFVWLMLVKEKIQKEKIQQHNITENNNSHNIKYIFSRYGLVQIANVTMITSFLIILSGVLYPIFFEVITNQQLTVGAEFFNQTLLPIMLIIIFFLAQVPRAILNKIYQASPNNHLKESYSLFSITNIVITTPFLTGLIGLYHYYYQIDLQIYHIFIWLIIGFLMIIIVINCRTAISVTKLLPFAKLVSLRNLNKVHSSFYASFFSHIGVILLFIAILLHTAFVKQSEQIVNHQQKIDFLKYQVKLHDISYQKAKNYIARIISLHIYDTNSNSSSSPNENSIPSPDTMKQEDTSIDNKTNVQDMTQVKYVMQPESRFYPVERKFTSEVDIKYGFLNNLYVATGQITDTGVIVRLFFKPAVNLIWFAVCIMMIGMCFSLKKNTNLRKSF